MADAGFFKGTSADQDRRFSDKELKLLKSMKFPSEFDKKVDMRKVNLQVIRPWIAKKVVELVGFEDEVVVEYAMGLLEDKAEPTPDPKKMQINLTGFLTNSTPTFMTALWNLLLEAQESPAGVPRTFVEEKKEEMRKAREGDTRALDERDRRARLDEIRQNERGNRGYGRGRGRGRGRGGFDDGPGRGRDNGWGRRGGGRGNRASSRSPLPSPPRRRSISGSPPFDPRSSRSPPPMRRYRSPPPRRRSPSLTPPYKPRESRSPPPPRHRPLSPRSLSRSPSPPRRRRRSPAYSPPPRDNHYRPRDSRSPPPRRRRISPPRRPTSRSPSRSRSPPPPPRSYRRRRSPSPPRRKRRPSLSKSRSPSRSPVSPPRRRDNVRRTPDRENIKPASLKRHGKRSRSRSMSEAAENRRSQREDKMSVSDDLPQNSKGELKIKGQAEAERRRSKWEEEADDGGNEMAHRLELERKESELKERALRNKVMRTRKGSTGAPSGGA